MSYDTAGAIEVLQGGLKGPRPQSFHQADGLVSRTLKMRPASSTLMLTMARLFSSWHGACYLNGGTKRRLRCSSRLPRSTAGKINKTTSLDLSLIMLPHHRSHATYYFIAGGCHISLKNYEKAQKLFDAVPGLLEKKKIGGKDLPTEVWIKKKRQCNTVYSCYSLILICISRLLQGEAKAMDWV